jgi:hypothetical protein
VTKWCYGISPVVFSATHTSQRLLVTRICLTSNGNSVHLPTAKLLAARIYRNSFSFAVSFLSFMCPFSPWPMEATGYDAFKLLHSCSKRIGVFTILTATIFFIQYSYKHRHSSHAGTYARASWSKAGVLKTLCHTGNEWICRHLHSLAEILTQKKF